MALAILLTFVLGIFLAYGALRLKLYAYPSSRGSHRNKVPNAGGIGIALCTIITLKLYQYGLGYPCDSKIHILLAGALMAGLLGFIDDRMDLSPTLRFWLLLLISSLTLWMTIPAPWMMLVVLIILHGGFINAYNFFDGLNGLAGLGLVMVLPFLALLYPENALLILSPVPGIIGFLVFNLRGKLFMGDGGALFLGSLFPLSIIYQHEHCLFQTILIMGHFLYPMLFDISLTVLTRIIKGQPVMKPHRDFYFLRLHDLGLGHLKVTGIYAGLHLIQGLLSLGFDLHIVRDLGMVYALNGILYGGLFFFFHKITARL